jgi:hypothetical protein
VAQKGEVFGGLTGAHAALILGEGHIACGGSRGCSVGGGVWRWGSGV